MEPIGAKTILIGKREIRLLYSNRALADAEKIMNKGIIGVLSGFEAGNSGIFEVAVLLQQGMEAARRYYREGGKRITLDDAYQLLDEIGFAGIAAPVFEAVGAVLSYDAESEDDSPND